MANKKNKNNKQIVLCEMNYVPVALAIESSSGTELYFTINWPTSKRICQRSLKCLKPNYVCNGMFSVE